MNNSDINQARIAAASRILAAMTSTPGELRDIACQEQMPDELQEERLHACTYSALQMADALVDAVLTNPHRRMAGNPSTDH